MSLANYFDNVKGIGILGTADPDGKVDLAIYSRPQVIDEHTVAFLMEDHHLSHDNVAANPHAAYLFIEDTKGYNGLRMHLTKECELTDPRKVEALRRKHRSIDDFPVSGGSFVQFKVDEVRPLTKGRLEAQAPAEVAAER